MHKRQWGRYKTKNSINVVFSCPWRQLSFLCLLLQEFSLLYLVCFSVIQAPTNSQHLIFTSIFSTNPEHVLCLFQGAWWVLCLCRSDGTTLRFVLVTGQMQLLCPALLTAAWWAAALQAKDRDAVAISWQWAGPATLQIPWTQTGLGAAWMGTDRTSPSWQHQDQTPIGTFLPAPQE